ncbi:NAD(P)-dependent oxidoreductase [Legionella sp.]|uniref:NAD(P)-dependent oxidoreductase n=1 Tax=Legionella sp. TaxID=459 RepID=UPI003C80E427
MQRDNLSILDILVEKTLTSSVPFPLAKTAVIYIHHALQTSLSLLKAQFKLGLAPQHTFVLNKHYSECSRVVEDIKNLGIHYQPCSPQVGLGKFSHSFTHDINLLWSQVIASKEPINQMIIMDHGGYALTFIPQQILDKYSVVGIEKTSAGLADGHLHCLPFPIIETASCAAKKILESPLIAEAIVTKLTPLIPFQKNITCGVIGHGAIGKALTEKLLSMGHQVIVYDKDFNQRKKVKGALVTNELSVAIAFADCIFGCTGQNIVTSIDLFRLCPNNKTLISCSSEDKEFLSLIQYIQHKRNQNTTVKPLSDVVYKNDLGATIHIVRGGFPVNFDDSGESVPRKDIELTRALVLGSTLQAVNFLKMPSLLKQGGLYMLDPKLQQFVVNEWLKIQPQARFSKDIRQKFQDECWIARHSGGIYNPGPE